MSGDAAPPDPIFTIASSNTAWVFVSASPEPRHFHDIVLGIDVLRGRGVIEPHIFVFSDQPPFVPLLQFQPFGMRPKFHKLADFSVVMGTLRRFDHVVVVVTGHGHDCGIGKPHLSPSAFYAAVRSTGVKAATVVLGQCYGGIFDLMDASKQSPEIAVIGATRLNLSISLHSKAEPPITSPYGPVELEWGANVFLANFFRWIQKPVDIDGDGRLTLTDAFKYAGTKSAEQLRTARVELTIDADEAKRELERLRQVTRDVVTPQSEEDVKGAESLRFRIEAAETKYRELLDMLYLIQDCWLLHARLALRTEFALP